MDEVSGNLGSHCGLPFAVHPYEPNTINVVPIKSDSEHFHPKQGCAYIEADRSATSGNRLSGVFRNVALALGAIGPAAIPALNEALKMKTHPFAALISRLTDEERIRVDVANALSRIGPAAVPLLSESLKDENASVRRSTARALDQIRSDADATGQSQ